jgi:hypothetical protein
MDYGFFRGEVRGMVCHDLVSLDAYAIPVVVY